MKIDTKKCSKRKNLMFYAICSHCNVVNRVTIDLLDNKLDVQIAEDDELDLVKELFSSTSHTINEEMYNKPHVDESSYGTLTEEMMNDMINSPIREKIMPPLIDRKRGMQLIDLGNGYSQWQPIAEENPQPKPTSVPVQISSLSGTMFTDEIRKNTFNKMVTKMISDNIPVVKVTFEKNRTGNSGETHFINLNDMPF
jgi:hypothetical protein